MTNICVNCIHKDVCYKFRLNYVSAVKGNCINYIDTTIDISMPTKLINMGSVYVCENCFSKNEVPTHYHFSDKVPKYCSNCGGHFTNIYRENNYYLIKEKEKDNDNDKTDFSRGECKSCRHRDPEDKKCDCGALERQGCYFPVSDDYYCKYYEEVTQ